MKLLILVIICRISVFGEPQDNQNGNGNNKEERNLDNQYLLMNQRGRRNGSANDKTNSVGPDHYAR